MNSQQAVRFDQAIRDADAAKALLVEAALSSGIPESIFYKVNDAIGGVCAATTTLRVLRKELATEAERKGVAA